MAPSYANIFKGELEKRLLKDALVKPSLYRRFIDDIFCIFEVPETQLIEFIEYMNEAHPTIKCTADYSEESAIFLATRVHVDQENRRVL